MRRRVVWLVSQVVIVGCGVPSPEEEPVPVFSFEAAGKPVDEPQVIFTLDGRRDDPPGDRPWGDADVSVTVTKKACNLAAPPIRECSDDLRKTLAIGDQGDVSVQVPDCAEFEEIYVPPNPVHQGGVRNKTVRVEAADHRVTVGSIFDTVVIRGIVTHIPTSPPPGTDPWRGGISTVLACLVHPMTGP